MRLLILIIALFSLTTSFASNNNEKNEPKRFSITGKVVDNNEALTGVRVVLDGKEMVVYTDFDGNFVIENVIPGEHILSLSLITYDNKVITFNPSNNNNLEIELDAK